MEDNEIPWPNLMSVLMDSCNVYEAQNLELK